MRITYVSTALLMGCMLFLTACSTPTTLTLNDGREIQAVDTPTYDEESGFYEVEQLDGKTTRINKDQVRTVKEL